MVIIKTCQSLDNLNKIAGQFLLEKEFKSKVHPGREESFLLGREALRLALCEYGLQPPLEKIILKTYDEVEGHPEFTLSLSHSQNCGVAALAKRSEIKSVGIDIEKDQRDVRDELVQKIAHPEDVSLRNIEIWILKEAIFKCLCNSHLLDNEPLFTDLRIEKEGWSHSPSGLRGEWEIRKPTPFVLALATLSN